jgi:hypothetical protein
MFHDSYVPGMSRFTPLPPEYDAAMHEDISPALCRGPLSFSHGMPSPNDGVMHDMITSAPWPPRRARVSSHKRRQGRQKPLRRGVPSIRTTETAPKTSTKKKRSRPTSMRRTTRLSPHQRRRGGRKGRRTHGR